MIEAFANSSWLQAFGGVGMFHLGVFFCNSGSYYKVRKYLLDMYSDQEINLYKRLNDVSLGNNCKE